MTGAPGEITLLLDSTRQGQPDALDRLLEAVYPSLRAIAGNLLRGERAGHTLNATGLAHEAVIRLFLKGHASIHDRRQLAAAAACQMRAVLVDHARRRLAQRRGNGASQAALSGLEPAAGAALETWLTFDKLLGQLRSFDPRAAEVVELRFFGGLSWEEIAARLHLSVKTVQRDWDSARAWLLASLSGS